MIKGKVALHTAIILPFVQGFVLRAVLVEKADNLGSQPLVRDGIVKDAIGSVADPFIQMHESPEVAVAVTNDYILPVEVRDLALFACPLLTFGFSFKDQFISAYDSFLTQQPSAYELQALTETTILSINYNDLQAVYNTTQIGNLIGRLTAERLFLIKSKREQNLLNLTAEERYIKLFKERPEVLKVIPLKYVSSYIGVTPQALSRIRKRVV